MPSNQNQILKMHNLTQQWVSLKPKLKTMEGLDYTPHQDPRTTISSKNKWIQQKQQQHQTTEDKTHTGYILDEKARDPKNDFREWRVQPQITQG